ncbi:MAG TPA: EAL domain-containing protein [Vicinamibacteria bacterium]|nr:EAL domain-containing protein [Vicinamibacteria bacterium]
MTIRTLPFRIGRRAGLELSLPYESVSKEHAEIYGTGDGLRVRDLHSRNGTFANQVRVHDAPLHEGDLLRIADFELRVVRLEADAKAPPDDTAQMGDLPTPRAEPKGGAQLVELLEHELVVPLFQPIVVLPGRAVVGFEALGRGRHLGLPEGPLDLLEIAEGIGVVSELSRLFRRKAVEAVKSRPDLPMLFLNTHPKELEHEGLIDSLAELRELAPDLKLVLEIHESGITDPLWVAHLRKELGRLGMRLAFDDFGIGQSRILELGDVPPHVLKFDRSLVSGIDQAQAAPRRGLLASLVRAAAELSVHTVAEGIETGSQAAACSQIGFSHAQGHYFGQPVAADRF